jgi:DNA-binding transcriptional LysR family regulator
MAILLKTVEAGSLSAAAKELEVPLASVSRRIAELEAHLDTRLLNRNSRRLNLTEAGRLYVEASKRILEQIEEAERTAMGVYNDPKGRLTITAPVVFGRTHIIPIVSDFLRQYPDIDIKLVLADRLLDLLEADVDIAVRIGDLADSSLTALKVGSVRRVTCASPSYLATHGQPEEPQDLRRHSCVTFDNLASSSAWRFMTSKGDVLVPVHSRLTVSTAEAAIAGAVAGLGLTRLLSYQVAPDIDAGRLAVVLEKYELPPWPVSLVHTGQQLPAKKLRAFLDFAGPRLKFQLQDEAAAFQS